MRRPNQFLSGCGGAERWAGRAGCRDSARQRGMLREGWGWSAEGSGWSQSPRVSVKRGRAAPWRARSGLTHLAPVPQDPRRGGGRGEGGVEKERGRACAVARGGAGTWQRARRLRASREPGGRRARAPWGRNPGPGKRGGATQRDVGGGSGRVPGRSPDRNPGERIRGSDSWVPRGQPSGAARLGPRG